jgi:hypothetical protein
MGRPATGVPEATRYGRLSPFSDINHLDELFVVTERHQSGMTPMDHMRRSEDKPTPQAFAGRNEHTLATSGSETHRRCLDPLFDRFKGARSLHLGNPTLSVLPDRRAARDLRDVASSSPSYQSSPHRLHCSVGWRWNAGEDGLGSRLNRSGGRGPTAEMPSTPDELGAMRERLGRADGVEKGLVGGREP